MFTILTHKTACTKFQTFNYSFAFVIAKDHRWIQTLYDFYILILHSTT